LLRGGICIRHGPHFTDYVDKLQESGIQESPETPVDGSMKEKVKRKKSKKKSSTASSHISADEGDEDAALERKKKAK